MRPMLISASSATGLRGTSSTWICPASMAPGKMQPVDDAGDIKDVGQPVAGMLVVGRRGLAHAEQRNAARQMVGVAGFSPSGTLI